MKMVARCAGGFVGEYSIRSGGFGVVVGRPDEVSGRVHCCWAIRFYFGGNCSCSFRVQASALTMPFPWAWARSLEENIVERGVEQSDALPAAGVGGHFSTTWC